MANQTKIPDYYDGVLSRPFLAEQYYRGFIAAIVTTTIFTFLFANAFDISLLLAGITAGTFSLPVLVGIISQHQRFELSLTRKRYRSSLWVLGLRFGEWQPLPPIDFVKIRHRQQQYQLPLTDGAAPALDLIAIEDKWQVLLHAADSPVGLVAAYVSQVKARHIATEIASLLHVEVHGL